MRHLLFIDSDTTLEFASRAKAFIYAERQGLKHYQLMTVYPTSARVSVFNTYIVDSNGELGSVEYFDSESDALKYIVK